MRPAISQEIIDLPKVLLHDHIDGGLRPQTIIELASKINLPLPSHEADAFQKLIYEACNQGSLEKYLKNFDYTIAVMQTEDNLIRVARECVLDLAADGIHYAEVRGAPELFTRHGLSMRNVVEATLEGLRQGMQEAKNLGSSITTNLIICAMRQNNLSLEAAQLALEFREKGVVGFDIAGPEYGFPARNHLPAFELLQRKSFPFTIHAGESDSFASMLEAINVCGASRIGHGIRIMDEIDISQDQAVLSDASKAIRDQQIHLEMSPTSNLQTGNIKDYNSHPAGVLIELGFNVALNTDNRLMSATSLSREYKVMQDAHNWDLNQINIMNANALRAAFSGETTFAS
ncbi:MAG: adenosine deaminase [Actinobacteria bacterium]|nr:adenosine deaminase [Actinomycetota bacterium]